MGYACGAPSRHVVHVKLRRSSQLYDEDPPSIQVFLGSDNVQVVPQGQTLATAVIDVGAKEKCTYLKHLFALLCRAKGATDLKN